MHGREARRRLVVLGLALIVALGTGVAVASAAPISVACETADTTLTVSAFSVYDSPYGRFIDGIISNETTVAVKDIRVDASFAESTSITGRDWVDGTLSPGEWASFHMDWPCSAVETWVPELAAGGRAVADDWDVPLKVDGIKLVSVNFETGMRSYVATITNDGAFAVSGIRLDGVERVDGEFLDTLLWWCTPEKLAPGESGKVELHSKAATTGTPVPELMAFGKERPTITLGYDTLEPYYGSNITFTLSLRDKTGQLITGWRTLKLYASCDRQDWWYKPLETETGYAIVRVAPPKPLYYRATFWGDERYGPTHSDVKYAQPKDVATIAAPGSVDAGQRFAAKGRMNGGTASAGKPVKVIAYRYSSSYRKWVTVASYSTSADYMGRFSRTLAFGTAGKWRVRGYRAGVGYTPYDYVSVTR